MSGVAIDFTTIEFAKPAYLHLLAVPGLLCLVWSWRLLRRALDVRRHTRVQVVPRPHRFSAISDLGFWFCLILASAFCIAALARPAARTDGVAAPDADLVVLVDGSASMGVKDVAPDRWQRAQHLLRVLLETLSWNGDRVALSLFAHRPAPRLHLTADADPLFFFLDDLGRRSPFVRDGKPPRRSTIEEGIAWGLKMIVTDEALFGRNRNPKAFVVISDGQPPSGRLEIALEQARGHGVPVHVVGVGTLDGGVIPPPSEAEPAAVLRSRLDRASLVEIARLGRGGYFEIDRQPDRDIAVEIVSSVRRQAKEVESAGRRQEIYWRFLLAAAVLVGAGTCSLRQPVELWWQAAVAAAAMLTIAASA